MEEIAGCFTLIVLLLLCWIMCTGCLSGDAVGLSVVCDCGISWLYSLAFLHFTLNTSHEQTQLSPFLYFIIVY